MAKNSLSLHQEISLPASLIVRLANAFNREEIVYCHWKSNIDLDQAMDGRTDLDLLVDRKSLPRALTILSHLGFKAAVVRWGANPPGIYHYYGLDPDTKQLIHVHLFSRVLTGESHVKGHLFPFDSMLLERGYNYKQIRVTSKPAELVLFTLRMFIKYGSLLDLVSLRGQSEKIKSEILWLQDNGGLSEALSLLKKHCPVIEKELFVKCVEALNSDHSLFRKMILAQKVRHRLKVYAKYSFLKKFIAYIQVLWAEVLRRLGTKQKNKVLQAGGTVIAFTGADATGKSTTVRETGRWLGNTFTVKIIHTGKPPSSWFTAPVSISSGIARKIISSQAISRIKNQTSPGDSNLSRHKFNGLSSLLYALRAITLARDRRSVIFKARRLAAKGEIIVCDRYPSKKIGVMDGPRLKGEFFKKSLIVSIYNHLARFEKQLYRQIPPPDLVLKLNVSLETAKKRNHGRDERDKDTYLEARHRQYRKWFMPEAKHVVDIDTEQTLEETLCDVKKAIWESL